MYKRKSRSLSRRPAFSFAGIYKFILKAVLPETASFSFAECDVRVLSVPGLPQELFYFFRSLLQHRRILVNIRQRKYQISTLPDTEKSPGPRNFKSSLAIKSRRLIYLIFPDVFCRLGRRGIDHNTIRLCISSSHTSTQLMQLC